MHLRDTFILIIATFLFSFTCEKQSGQPQFFLSEQTINKYDILIYDSSNVIQQFAASELKKYLNKVYGEEIEITTLQNSVKVKHFLLGAGFIRGSLFETDSLSKDAFVKAIKGGNIYLAGKDDSDVVSIKVNFYQKAEKANFGTLYAVYDFLENDLGMHWFFPTYLGEYVSKETKKVLEESTKVEEPAFSERIFNFRKLYHDRDTIMFWYLRNRVSIAKVQLYYHNWGKVLPPSEFYDEFPYIYAEVDGQRRKTTRNNRPGQLCTTNKTLIKLFLNSSIQYLRDHPNQINFSLSPTDTKLFCECNQCMAADTCLPVINNYSELSCRIFNFYKIVSDSLWEYKSELEIGGLAYKQYCYAPDNIKLSEKFHVRINLNNYGFGTANCSTMDTLKLIISSWAGKHDNLGFSSHPYGGLWVYPILRTNTHQSLIKFLNQRNIKKVKFDFYPEWYSQGLDIWLITKMLWKPDIDVDSLKTIYYNSVFPNSKEIVRQFHNDLEENINKLNVCTPKYTSWKTHIPLIFKEIFTEVMLDKTVASLNRKMTNEILLNNEKDNLTNFLEIITFLQMENEAYRNPYVFKLLLGAKEKQRFREKVKKMQTTLCLTPKSVYFIPDRSPSLYLKE